MDNRNNRNIPNNSYRNSNSNNYYRNNVPNSRKAQQFNNVNDRDEVIPTYRKYKKNKKKSKVLPRVVAIIIALLAILVIFIAIRYGIYKPTNNKDDPSFELVTSDNSSKKDLISDDSSYNFLIMGHDRAANLTDVIMLINYNVKDQKLNIMQFPRDTYIEVDDYYYHKVNGLYSYYYNQAIENNSKNPEKDGVTKCAEYFEKNLAIKISYSAVMDLDGFEGIVDAIGGIDMYVPQNMYYVDVSQNLVIDLQEGYQHLDGNKAEQFVRYRSGYLTGDIGRGDAQKLFVSAFIKKLKESITDVSKVTALASNVIKYVYTDITDADLVYFVKAFVGISTKSKIEMSDIQLFTMPGNGCMYDYASMYVMNKQYVSELVDEYFNVYDTSIISSFDKNKVFVTESEYTDVGIIYYDDKENIYFNLYTAAGLESDGLN